MKKVALLFLVSSVFLGVSAHAENADIENPNQEILTVNKEKQTRLDLYEALEVSGNFGAALDALDYKFMENKFKDDKRLPGLIEKKYNEKADQLKENDINITDDYALYGANNKEEYILKAGIKLDALRELAETKVASEEIFTKEEKDYLYQSDFSAKNKIYAILISPNLTDAQAKVEKDVNDGLAKALKDAEAIKKEIKDLDQFKKVANEKSADTFFKDGYLGEFTMSSAHDAGLDQGIIDAAFATKPGEVSKPVLTTYGYYLLMSEEVEKAPEYDSVASDIQAKLYSLYEQNNPYFTNYALYLYRENNKAGFSSSVLEKSYANNFIQTKKSYLQYNKDDVNNYNYGLGQ